MVEPRLLVPGVYLLPFEIGQVYIWDWGDGLTIVDTGIAGSADTIVRAVEAIGRRPDEVREIVLTHYHDDHRGSASTLADRTGASIVAHVADAPVIRGNQPQAPPVLLDFERPIFEAVTPLVPRARPTPVDREVEDGDTTEGGGTIVGVPGHTPGSIALYVPDLRVLFTGDTIAFHEGAPILGVFNVDRAEAIRSVRKQSRLEVNVACFGHGPPIIGDAKQRLRKLADRLQAG
jgi:glyoxylase-like metal-dependent hydrolase (beta-lactamase superfamily II)